MWIFITLLAAFLQNMRSALQKRLQGKVSTGGATFARFVFAAPVAALWLALTVWLSGTAPFWPGHDFWLFSALGGGAQIVATYLLLASFANGSFAVGTALSKTESLQAAAFSVFLLSEGVGRHGLFGLVVGLAGVWLLVAGKTGRVTLKGAFLALASGAAFAISAVSYRKASLSLEDGPVIVRAAMTLLTATVLQTLAMGLWLRMKEPGSIGKVVGAWRLSAPAALSGVVGSICWITAMTMQQVAYVRALGQVELVFSVLSGVFLFHEKVSMREVAGIALIALSIILVLIESM